MLVDREMTYDAAGNVTAVNDRVAGRTSPTPTTTWTGWSRLGHR